MRSPWGNFLFPVENAPYHESYKTYAYGQNGCEGFVDRADKNFYDALAKSIGTARR